MLTRVIVSPTRASVHCTHVLLDYENVQPSDAELRALVPDAGQVWVFHGPHQREVEKRFASFGADATAVPISKTGKNALDFHLSFYMGYIASRNPDSKMVVVANDKGYEPMLEHAKAMGFAVRRESCGEVKPPAKKAAAKKAQTKTGADKTAPAKKVAAKKAAAKKAAPKNAAAKKAATKPVAGKQPLIKVPASSAASRKASSLKVVPAKNGSSPPASRVKGGVARPARALAVPASVAPIVKGVVPVSPLPKKSVTEADIKRIIESLRKIGASRPTKPTALRRLVKSLLAADTGDASIEVALGRLAAARAVVIKSESDVKYPLFESGAGAGAGAS